MDGTAYLADVPQAPLWSSLCDAQERRLAEPVVCLQDFVRRKNGQKMSGLFPMRSDQLQVFKNLNTRVSKIKRNQ